MESARNIWTSFKAAPMIGNVQLLSSKDSKELHIIDR